MPRPSTPWFRAAKNSWYITINGQKRSLNVQGRRNRRAAIYAWHQLLAGGTTVNDDLMLSDEGSVGSIFREFLADCRGRIGEETLRGYKKFLLPFADVYGLMDPLNITPQHAETFSRKPEWSASYRHGFLSALVTAFRWAKRNRRIKRNPLEGIRKPAKASRGAKVLVPPEVHQQLLAVAPEAFKPFLELLWFTGARPGEIAGLAAEDIDVQNGLAIVSEHKTTHLGKRRVIYFCADAMKIVRELMKTTPRGLFFPGSNGKKMTSNAVSLRMMRLCDKAGVKAIAYGYRHTYGTDALTQGLPDAHVAALMGHTGTNMLHHHYSHITSRARVLKEAAAFRRN